MIKYIIIGFLLLFFGISSYIIKSRKQEEEPTPEPSQGPPPPPISPTPTPSLNCVVNCAGTVKDGICDSCLEGYHPDGPICRCNN